MQSASVMQKLPQVLTLKGYVNYEYGSLQKILLKYLCYALQLSHWFL